MTYIIAYKKEAKGVDMITDSCFTCGDDSIDSTKTKARRNTSNFIINAR